MALWLIFLSFLSLSLKLLLNINKKEKEKEKKKLPPSPPTLPLVGNVLSIGFSLSDIEAYLLRLRTKFGSILTLYIGPNPSIFITTRSLTHEALIQNGVVFASRPPSGVVSRIFNGNQHTINSAPYGPLWRLLRRNLISGAFNPARLKSYSKGREWVLNNLKAKLTQQSRNTERVLLLEDFIISLFGLSLFMCFGEMLGEGDVRDMETLHRDILAGSGRLTTPLNIFPTLRKFIFRKRWMKLLALRRRQEEALTPLIHAHKDANNQNQEQVFSYVDSLLALDLPEGRKLDDGELVSLCTEFLNGCTYTVATTLEWILANLVKYPKIQEKLVKEMEGVVGFDKGMGMIKDGDIEKMSYLKAVIMETLRKHPPGHFVLPHVVLEEVSLEGYVIPKNATVNFMIREMGMDPEVWDGPSEFRPERFLGGDTTEVVDITGSREIKMIPFGAGRRMCPAYGFTMYHLEYFVANLVWEFEWKARDGEEVDLAERLEITVVMKKPLQAVMAPRRG